MKPCGDESDIEQALLLIGHAVLAYMADDRHWNDHQTDEKPALRWPSSVTLWWRFYSAAFDHAWNLGRHTRPDAPEHLLDRVAKAATEHALQACRKHFGTGYLSGARAERNRANEHAVGQALRDGAPSLGAAFDVSGVSRSAGKRILSRRHKRK